MSDRITVRDSVPPEYAALVIIAIGLAVVRWSSHPIVGWIVAGLGLAQLVLMPGDAWIVDRAARRLTRRSRRCFFFVHRIHVDLARALAMEIEADQYIDYDSDVGETRRTPQLGYIVLPNDRRFPVPAPEKVARFLGLTVNQIPTRTWREKWRDAKKETMQEWCNVKKSPPPPTP